MFTVHCGKCNHQWELDFDLPIPISGFVKAANVACAVGCPKCGAKGRHILCGPALNLTRKQGVGIVVSVNDKEDADETGRNGRED